jgi:hypothetical protein
MDPDSLEPTADSQLKHIANLTLVYTFRRIWSRARKNNVLPNGIITPCHSVFMPHGDIRRTNHQHPQTLVLAWFKGLYVVLRTFPIIRLNSFPYLENTPSPRYSFCGRQTRHAKVQRFSGLGCTNIGSSAIFEEPCDTLLYWVLVLWGYSDIVPLHTSLGTILWIRCIRVGSD